jgi:hypothetical protein
LRINAIVDDHIAAAVALVFAKLSKVPNVAATPARASVPVNYKCLY